MSHKSRTAVSPARAGASSDGAKQPTLPRSDKVTRLTDPGVHERLAALKRSMADPAKARAFLQDVGTLTPSGKRLTGGCTSDRPPSFCASMVATKLSARKCWLAASNSIRVATHTTGWATAATSGKAARLAQGSSQKRQAPAARRAEAS